MQKMHLPSPYKRLAVIAMITGTALVMALQGRKRTCPEEQLEGQNRIDNGASPVFSALSKLERRLQNKSLPDIIKLDYEPIELKEGMSRVDVQDAIISLSLQRQVVCRKWEVYGDRTDGGWPVCKAQTLIPTRPCTVYSFGIRYDWSFDDAYRAAHGCTMRTFDPSMVNETKHEHRPGVFFYPIGISDKREVKESKKRKWYLDTYRGLLKRFGEENDIIPYLKFDIETMEWKVLENMLADGSLRNVMQLSFEMHVHDLHEVRTFFKIIKKLEAIGFRRWFYHHRLNGYPFQCDQSYINTNYLDQPL